MKNRRSFRPSLEVLEGRDTPAGTVTGSFANGTWTLVCDAEANDILVNPPLLPGPFTLIGRNGTAVAGVTKVSNPLHIVVILGAGDDWVEVNDTGHRGGLPGDLTIRGGQGANSVDINNFRMKNLAVVNGLNASGTDQLYLSDSIVQQNITVNHGSGATLTKVFRSAGASGVSRVGGNVTVVNGVGEDSTELTDTHVGGNVTVKNGLPGADGDAGYVNIQNFHNLATRSVIGGNVLVSYEGGTVDYDGIWDTEVLGNVTFRYGSGTSEVNFASFHTPRPVHIAGNLTVISQGNTRVETASPNDQLGVDVGKDFTILTGGGTDQINIRASAVGGTTRVVTGAGDDRIVIDDSSFAGLTTILTGGGLDTLFVECDAIYDYGTQFAQALQVQMGADNDTLTMGVTNDMSRFAEFLGAAVLDGGAGEDTFNRLNLVQAGGRPITALFETINR